MNLHNIALTSGAKVIVQRQEISPLATSSIV